MRRFSRISIFVAALAWPTPGRDGPPLPDNFIARPQFFPVGGGLEAGTAFYLRFGAGRFIVTAHHLFGPMGGLEEEVPPAGLKESVASIRMTGIRNPVVRKFKVRPLPVPQERTLTAENPFYDRHVDLAIFRIESTPGIDWGSLSEDTLKIGDRVWQAAEPLAGGLPGELLHACRIIRLARGHAFCLFENQGLVLNGTSGSPYVDSGGEVLGLHSGSLKKPGRLTGIILLAPVIRRALETAAEP